MDDATAPEQESPPDQASVDVPPMLPSPWGFWMTMGLSLMVMAVSLVLQIVAVVATLASRAVLCPGSGFTNVSDVPLGLLTSISTWIMTPVCLALMVWFTRPRRGWRVADYLALRPVRILPVVGWTGALLAFLVLADCVAVATEQEGSDYSVQLYRTAYWMPLLWVTVVLVVPLFEELLFRGFMLRGLRHSSLGAVGAVVLTSLCWTALHVQYTVFQLLIIFVTGLLLGAARLRTQSLYPALVMHGAMNLMALVQVAWLELPG